VIARVLVASLAAFGVPSVAHGSTVPRPFSLPGPSNGPAWTTAGRETYRGGVRESAKTYHATGVIRSFGGDRAWVNIAHDAIPGYMGAMTMSFWPQRKEQFDGLVVGDAVEFEFTETEDARRLISSIRKRR